MFKWIVVFCFVARPAMAAESIFLYLASAGVSVGLATTLAGIVTAFGKTLLLSAAQSLLSKKRNPSSPEYRAELRLPQDLPAVRFVYGHTRAPGTQWPVRVVGKVMYGCFLLNSRPSAGNFTLILDNREVEFSGDPFDFSEGGGATATNAPFTDKLKFWYGLGDQTSPPYDFIDEASEHYKVTDGWRNLTVVFLRCDKTGVSDVQELWPNFPPEVDVLGDWSLVYDQSKETHDLDDPSTWEFSRNQGLCTLDALTQNPIEKYRPENLRMDLFAWAKDVAEEAVPLKAGGTEPRYCTDGFIVFNDSEIEDQLKPLFDAGAAKPVRISGRLGIIPGEYVEPSMTITDMLEGGFQRTVLRPSDQLPTHLNTFYTSADRNYERAPLAPYEIPGALTADGGVAKPRDQYLDLVTSPTQGMRVRKIEGNLARAQKGIAFTAPPDAFELVSGSTVTLGFSAPFSTFNGGYRVEKIDPIAGEESEGVALRCPIELTEYSASFYSWTPAVDEEDVIVIEYDSTRSTIAIPGEITASFDSVTNTGVGYARSLRIEFAPSASAAATRYEVQFSIEGQPWGAWNTVDASVDDGSGNVFTEIYPVDFLATYRVRVRTITATGESKWRVLTGILSTFELSTVSAEAVAGGAEFTATAPAYESFAGVKIFRAATGAGFGAAVAVSGLIEKTAGASFTALAGDATVSNEVANGTFDDATGWTLDPDWSIGGGYLTHSPNVSGADYATHNVTLVDGADYRYTMRRVSGSGGSVGLDLVGDTTVSSTPFTSNKLWQGIFAAPDNTTDVSIIAVGFSGNMDDLWVIKDTPDLLSQGAADFWIAPISANGTQGPEEGPFTLTIY